MSVNQESGRKRAPKTMLRWRKARLARIQCEFDYWSRTLDAARADRLRERLKQLKALIKGGAK